VNRWRTEFLYGYRDPYKGSTMMVLRGGRIDRRWGGPYGRAWDEVGVVGRARWPIHGRESVCSIERRRYS
jgi:hypothetical protein